MIRRVVLLFAVIALSLSVLCQVSSYSLAELSSETGIRITESEDALIGISSSIDAGQAMQNSSKSISIDITNNMSVPIRITGIEGSSSGVDISLTDIVEIPAGTKAGVSVKIKVSLDADLGYIPINVSYRAEWNGGSAVIEGSLVLDIQKPDEIKCDIQDVVLNNTTFIKAKVISRSNEKYEVLGIEFPEDKYIQTDLEQVTIRGNKLIFPVNITSMEPNLYEVPVEFRLNDDGCVTTIKTVIYLNIKSGKNNEQASVGEVNDETSSQIGDDYTSNEDTICNDVENAD